MDILIYLKFKSSRILLIFKLNFLFYLIFYQSLLNYYTHPIIKSRIYFFVFKWHIIRALYLTINYVNSKTNVILKQFSKPGKHSKFKNVREIYQTLKYLHLDINLPEECAGIDAAFVKTAT